MTENKKKPSQLDTQCSMSATLEVIGGKWKGVILYHLSQGTKRFNELTRLIPNITQRMLTRQLRELEEHGIILRVIYPQIPPKVEYSLTDIGQTLRPIINTLTRWGEFYEETIRK
ncbi:winged helix-turn-helix transcriptional regulator [Ephemeroptericola cinctiostellae]|nr:helix-turn-helix domain-containing protein [Ephemeroptericola cinctiostellae]